MRKYLITDSGKFYKANLHSHSTWSDGKHTPAELKGLYKERGYSVLAITDHEGLFYHPELDDDGFLTVCGMELQVEEWDNERGWYYTPVSHLCFYKKDISEIYQPGYDAQYFHPKFAWMQDAEKVKLIKGVGEPFSKKVTAENVNRIIKTMRENGFLAMYNHPVWSNEDKAVCSRYSGMNFLEVYNHSCFMGGHDEFNGKVYDELLRRGERPLYVLANDDNHYGIDNPYHDMFGGFSMIKAERLDYKSIINSLEHGDFYASTGPLINEIYFEDGKITIRTESEFKYARLVSGNRYAKLYVAPDSEARTAVFDIPQNCVYVRFEISDNCGNRAYTNAYFTDELYDKK